METTATKYLSMNGLEFKDGASFNGAYYDLLPSTIVPEIEIIKKTERSLGGKMHVDITDVKKKLKITFDLCPDSEFNFIREYLGIENVLGIDADGIEVEYFDFVNAHKKETMRAFVDNFTFTPFIAGDDIEWRDVTIELVEI